jgi:hypothetical protein
MATIKITTANNLPRFVHGGIEASNTWTDLDLDKLSEEQREALTQYTGSHIRVHDESADTYRQYLAQHGMTYEDGKVVDPQREERARKRAEADAEAQRTARGTSPGRAPIPPREDTSFQGPPGAGQVREVDPTATAAQGTREVRSRDSSPTDPDRPSNKPRPR